MKQKHWSKTLGAGMLAFGAWMMTTSATAGPPNPAMLSNACAGCHGTGGGSAGPAMPSLAGQSKEAIVVAMKKFKSGERPSTIMGRLAKGYTDADFEAMGEFFSKKKRHPTQQTLDAARVARGAALREANCAHCHLEDGKQGKEETPALAGQWLPYMQMQMALYLSNQRKMPQEMAEKVRPLSVDDLEALLHFYASVK